MYKQMECLYICMQFVCWTFRYVYVKLVIHPYLVLSLRMHGALSFTHIHDVVLSSDIPLVLQCI